MTRLVYMPGVCRECGCDDDHACVDAGGQPCSWVEPDLCSACAPLPSRSVFGPELEELVDEDLDYPYEDT